MQAEAEPEYTDPLERAIAEERQAREGLEQRLTNGKRTSGWRRPSAGCASSST